MNISKIRAISLLLALIMVFGSLLTSCVSQGGEDGSDSETVLNSGESSESAGESEKDDSESESSVDDTEDTEEGPKYEIEGDFGTSILEADELKGGVNTYYESGLRDKLIVENKNVILGLGLSKEDDGVVTVLSKKGGTFLERTMDPYIKTEDGKYYYGSNSVGGSDANVYRWGYYMHDVHVFGGDFFADGVEFTEKRQVPVNLIYNVAMGEQLESEKDVFAFKVTDITDPRVYLQPKKLSADAVSFFKFSMKSEGASASSYTGQIYIRTENMDAFSSDMCLNFDVIADGEYHEYVMNFSTLEKYAGRIDYIRFDVGSTLGEVVEIKDMSAFNVEGDVPSARIDRSFYVYSDKLNQVLHLIAPSDSENVSEYGFEIRIPEEKVNKVITSDRRGEHDTVEGVHWGSADFVGFDIKDVGVFGFIMINDRDYRGRFKVSLEDGDYVIRHFANPTNGEIPEGTDLYLGHRLYFGDTHSFDELIFEAYCEANPLTDITVTTTGSSPMGRFYAYDGLRGAYKYDVRYGNWNNIFLNAQNMHYNVKTTINGDGRDRKIYVYTSAVSNGQTLECAVLMDENDVLIPIPLEVCKNFAGDGEANEFLADEGYSEVYFPLVVGADASLTFTMAHLYQNWGKVPLKQIDSIQYYAPFYHLSTGVTETNCIRPWYTMAETKNTNNIYFLPDHRAMSAPLWIEFKDSRDPQHTNGGFHNFLEYVGTEGKYVTTEFTSDTLMSYGPTYGELKMNYITDDGKIKVSYTHMEMPQTDENRAFYICTYEFLEDLTVTDSKKNFSFYSVAGRYVDYAKLGYLDENNVSQIVDTTLEGEATYLLGDECPYFDSFGWLPSSEDPETEGDYVNVGCLIYSYSVEMGGESFEDGLMLYVKDEWVHLTLNADTLSFKKGDKISLNMILVPWGSQQSDYDREDPDRNIREVRKNTLLDPMTVTVIDGEAVDSVYLPRVRSKDGKSAEFTLSGGENNVAVEIQGMTAIARPVIKELIDGEWVEVVISSKDTPDSRGNAHEYDGYMIRYDGDGTFSYSFVVDMTGDARRTLRVTVE